MTWIERINEMIQVTSPGKHASPNAQPALAWTRAAWSVAGRTTAVHPLG